MVEMQTSFLPSDFFRSRERGIDSYFALNLKVVMVIAPMDLAGGEILSCALSVFHNTALKICS